ARRLGISAASLMHLAWALVLARTSGRDDVVFGTVLFGRMQGGEQADRVLGMFINTLPIRLKLANQNVETGLKAAHQLLAQLLRHEHAPLALAQRCSGVQAPTPLFSALLNFRHSGVVHADAVAVEEGVELLHTHDRTNYPLTVSVDDLGEGFLLSAQTVAPIRAARVCSMLEQAVASLLDALTHAPQARLDTLAILPEAELQQLAQWNDTALDYPRNACLHELIEAQVNATPDAVAVVCGDQQLSYAELNTRANQLAHYLRALGVGPDERVAVCVERRIEMIIGMLAILKAGGAYVPLDPSYPSERVAYMLEHSDPVAILVDTRGCEVLQQSAAEAIQRRTCLHLQADAGLWEQAQDANPQRVGLESSHLAYVIYTSGSTGLPKGVAIEHRNAVNFICWAQSAFERDELQRTLFATSINFDLAVYEYFTPLSLGCTLHLVDNALALLTQPQDVTLINTVPSAMSALVNAGAISPQTRVINLAGEALKRDLVERIFARTGVERVCNLYGPTETTTYSTWCSMERATGFVTHVGRPVGNTQVHILAGNGQHCPIGVAGELYIGGDG
ncbi:amino acid adenylation domain-containing protein, partial [Andreprevotia lacus DSM 23236]